MIYSIEWMSYLVVAGFVVYIIGWNINVLWVQIICSVLYMTLSYFGFNAWGYQEVGEEYFKWSFVMTILVVVVGLCMISHGYMKTSSNNNKIDNKAEDNDNGQ